MVLSRDRAFYRQVLRLSGWIALQNVVVCLVGLADNIMLGAYSQNALTGAALANQLQFFLQMLVGGIGEGMAVLTAQYWGEGRLKPIRSVVAIALELSLAVGVVFGVAAQLLPEGILGLLTNDSAAIAEGAAYMRIVCFSYPFFCVGLTLMNAQRSVENVKVNMVASVSALVANIGLNGLLIFGGFGIAPMGARGAAVATLLARVLECGIMVVYTYRIDKKLAIRLEQFLRLDRGLLRDFRRVATPVILSGGSWGIAMTVQTAILGHLGAIAANAIANSLFQVIVVVAYGMASASAVIIGKAVGRDDRGRLREYVNTLQVLYLAVGVLSGLTLFLLKDWILSMYAITPESKEMARSFMVILSVTVVGTSYQCSCLTGIVRGGGNTKFVFYNDLIFMWGIVLPVSLLAAFVFHWNPIWVFFCLKSDQLIKCAVAAWQVNSYRWVKKVTRKEQEESSCSY